MEIDLAQISSSNESPRSPHQRRLEKQSLCDGWGEALLEAKTSRQACWEKAFLTQIKASSGQAYGYGYPYYGGYGYGYGYPSYAYGYGYPYAYNYRYGYAPRYYAYAGPYRRAGYWAARRAYYRY